MPKESTIQSNIAKALRKNGWLVNTNIAPRGWPDIRAWKNGRAVFIEVKQPGKDLDPVQKIMKNRITKNSFEHYIMKNKNDVTKLLSN